MRMVRQRTEPLCSSVCRRSSRLHRQGVANSGPVRSDRGSEMGFPLTVEAAEGDSVVAFLCISAQFQETSVRKTILVAIASIFLAPAVVGSAQGDVTTPIHQFIDGFNSGDTKSAFAAYATGVINIVDEFAPHRWIGPHAAQGWAADYDKHEQATGVSEGQVKYSAP